MDIHPAKFQTSSGARIERREPKIQSRSQLRRAASHVPTAASSNIRNPSFPASQSNGCLSSTVAPLATLSIGFSDSFNLDASPLGSISDRSHLSSVSSPRQRSLQDRRFSITVQATTQCSPYTPLSTDEPFSSPSDSKDSSGRENHPNVAQRVLPRERSGSAVNPLIGRRALSYSGSHIEPRHHVSQKYEFVQKPCLLPTIRGSHPQYQILSPATVASLLFDPNNMWKQHYSQVLVIDCRYPFEYEGGHIKGALNSPRPADILPLLFQDTREKVAIVFHCEFSSKRAPQCYEQVRKMDRQLNIASYPALSYPEIYIMEGGYCNFFQEYSHHCTPQAYVEMTDRRFQKELLHWEKLREHSKSSFRYSRSQSFAGSIRRS